MSEIDNVRKKFDLLLDGLEQGAGKLLELAVVIESVGDIRQYDELMNQHSILLTEIGSIRQKIAAIS